MAELQRVDQDPQYQQSLTKARAIRDQLAAVEMEIRAYRENADHGIDAAVASVLAGRTVEPEPQADLERLHQQRRILQKALSVAEQAAATERRRVVVGLCKRLEGEAMKVGEQTCRAVLAVYDTMLSEKTFFDSLKARFGLLASDLPPTWRPDPGWWRFLSGCPDGIPLTNPNCPTRMLLEWYMQHRQVDGRAFASRLVKPRV